MTDPACISRIKGHYLNDPDNIDDSRDYLEVYPGYIQIRFGENKAGTGSNGHSSIRGKITTFSPDSRRRLLKRYGSLSELPNLWFDLTFPDDMMENLTLSERAKLAYSTFRKFNKRIARHRQLSSLWGIVRKDWQDRKTGQLKGEEVPHFHVIAGGLSLDQKNYSRTARRILRIWVNCLKTKNPNVMKVALHEKSYRYLVNAKMAFNYAAKYCAKLEGHEDNESRGRFWFTLGQPPYAAPITIRTYQSESDLLRRVFRRLHKRTRRLNKALSSQHVTTWFFCSLTTTLHLLHYISDQTAPPF